MIRKVILSDLQVPDHDPRAVNAVLAFLDDYKPEELHCVGDEADATEVSRWVRGRRQESGGGLQAGLDQTFELFSEFREVIGSDTPFHVQRSNHTDRLKNYIDQYGPGLNDLRALDYVTLVGFDELGITFHHQPHALAPGWRVAHGDEGSSIKTAGGTAMNLARRFGVSIACGHTHKLGLQHDHAVVGGKRVRSLWGMEVGNLMDLKKASYLKAGSANWQQGIGVITVDGNHVTPFLVPINNGKLTFDGKTYRG